MGPLGGLGVEIWVFEGPRPSGNRNKMIWSKKKFSKNVFFGRFLNTIVAILCVKSAKMAPFGGSRGVQNQFFLGSKPTQDPMNNVFEQKILVEKKHFQTPGPPTENFFGPSPGQAAGGPKGGQNRSVGVSNPSKTVGHPQGTLEKVGSSGR